MGGETAAGANTETFDFSGKHSCVFTGHRPAGLPAGGNEAAPEMCALKTCILSAVRRAAEQGVTDFYAGGADGFDLLASEAVLALQESCPQCKLHLALPGPRHGATWQKDKRARLARLVAAAESVYVSSEYGVTATSLLSRNRYMVEHADCCICYLVSMRGGTLYTVNYAMDRGLPVYNLAICS